jgi:ArsR family transcriptional regulator
MEKPLVAENASRQHRFATSRPAISFPTLPIMDTTSLVKLAKSLSDPTRLRLLQEIAQRSQMGCADLFEFVPISQPSMSQHVKALVEAGLVESHKQGRNVYLTINAAKLQELENFLQLLRISPALSEQRVGLRR